MFFQKRNLQEFFSKLSGSTVFFFEENYKKVIFFNSEQLRGSQVNFCIFSLTQFPFS